MHDGAIDRHAMPFLRDDHQLVVLDEGKLGGIAESELGRLFDGTDRSGTFPLVYEFCDSRANDRAGTWRRGANHDHDVGGRGDTGRLALSNQLMRNLGLKRLPAN